MVRPDADDYCPICGAELTIIGTNTEGWVVICTFGHQDVWVDRSMVYGLPVHAPPKTDGTRNVGR